MRMRDGQARPPVPPQGREGRSVGTHVVLRVVRWAGRGGPGPCGIRVGFGKQCGMVNERLRETRMRRRLSVRTGLNHGLPQM